MPDYCIYFLGRDNRIKQAQPFRCKDDQSALAEGERICGEDLVEIWERSRLVARVTHCAVLAVGGALSK